MIESRIQIGDGATEDFRSKWGFIYMDADERTEAPIKKRDAISYVEEAGEHTDPRTVQAAFDYTAQFLIEAPNYNMRNANSVIAKFNKALYTQEADSGIRHYKRVTFFNDHNRVKIVGLPEPIAEPKEFYRRDDGSQMDCVLVELKIRVDNPAACDFDLSVGEGIGYMVIEQDFIIN